MKTNKLALAIAGCLLSLAAQTSRANSITYVLDSSHDGSFASGTFGFVEIDLTSSTTANVTFTAASGYAFFDSGIADLNLASPSTVTASGFSADITGTGSGNEDGYGTINLTTKSGGSPPSESSVTFTLTDNSGTWTDPSTILAANSPGGWFAVAHVIGNGSTFFVGSDGTTTNNDQLPVPDGGTTIMMLGSALAGLGVVGRRLRKS